MIGKPVLLMALIVILTCTLCVASELHEIRATGTIYIRTDGSIDGPFWNIQRISTADNITYTFTNDIADMIVVQRSNIIVNGNGYTQWYGFHLSDVRNVTIKNTHIYGRGSPYGVYLNSTSNNVISSNNITDSIRGIYLESSSFNTFSKNDVKYNEIYAIHLDHSSNNNNVSENKIAYNYRGVLIESSSFNRILENEITGITDISGIQLDKSSHNSISGNNITAIGGPGIHLSESSNSNSISGNNITDTRKGIEHFSSSHNSISGNNITDSEYGIRLIGSSNNSISQNSIANNFYDIYLGSSSSNRISGNTITNSYQSGIELRGSSGNSISRNKVTNNNGGIVLRWNSDNNSVSGNNITNNNDFGIQLDDSYNNSISRNNIANNKMNGIHLHRSSNNTISGNNIEDNFSGIWLEDALSSNDVFYHNNFIENSFHVDPDCHFTSSVCWDNGYPSGGNYWSDYTGTDLNRGPHQNETGSDGIGDSPYVRSRSLWDILDNYPLVGMLSSFIATSEYLVPTISNSTISDFQYNGTAIAFNVSGEDGTLAFCRICIPTALMNDTYKVFVNGTEVTHTLLPFSNSTHNYLYFNYMLSTKEVLIIPEFPSSIILPVFMIITLLAVIVYKRKHSM